MKRIYIFIIAFYACLLSSCYDDKGNYDYRQMNDIEIKIPLETNEYSMGDILKIEPELSFSLNSNSDNLAYSWSLNRREISTDRNLNWIVDEEGKLMDLRLTVTNVDTGVSYFGSGSITVTSPYVKNGWVILSEKDGISMLTYLKPTTKKVEGKDGKEEEVYDCIVTKDVYGISNGGASLSGKPISISQHFVSFWPEDKPEDVTSWLWLVQQGGQGNVDISGSTYQMEGTLPTMFINGGYPSNFEPKRVYDMLYLTMAIGTNGLVYTRVKDSYKLFNNSYFLDEMPLSYDQQPVDGTMLVRAPRFCEQGGTLLYDKNSQRYFHLCDYSTEVYSPSGNYIKKSSGRLIIPTVTNKSIYDSNPDWGRLDDMSGYNVLYLDTYKDDSWSGLNYKSLIEKNGRIYFQDFTVSSYWGGNSIDAEFGSQTEVTAELSSIINTDSKYALFYSPADRPYLLITRGNTLYFYYFKGSAGNRVYKYHEFDAPITSIDVDNTYNYGRAGIGLENGEFYVLDFSDTVIGEIMNTGDSKDKVSFKLDGLGRIVESIFKWQQAANWI